MKLCQLAASVGLPLAACIITSSLHHKDIATIRKKIRFLYWLSHSYRKYLVKHVGTFHVLDYFCPCKFQIDVRVFVYQQNLFLYLWCVIFFTFSNGLMIYWKWPTIFWPWMAPCTISCEKPTSGLPFKLIKEEELPSKSNRFCVIIFLLFTNTHTPFFFF